MPFKWAMCREGARCHDTIIYNHFSILLHFPPFCIWGALIFPIEKFPLYSNSQFFSFLFAPHLYMLLYQAFVGIRDTKTTIATTKLVWPREKAAKLSVAERKVFQSVKTKEQKLDVNLLNFTKSFQKKKKLLQFVCRNKCFKQIILFRMGPSRRYFSIKHRAREKRWEKTNRHS